MFVLEGDKNMKKCIVIINGSGGVGKDTFIEYCNKFSIVKNISSVDMVKEAAKVLVDWNGEKDEKSRKLLSDLKKLSIDYNDYPAKYIQEKSEEFLENNKENIMFIHVREIEEIKKLKKILKAKTLLITSNRIEKILSNSSDSNVENYDYDLYIANDGTMEELEEKAKKFVHDLIY